MGTLDGRTAIVTGGTRGIGAAIAASLAADGAHVALGYSRSAAHAEEARAKLSSRGWSVSVHQGNVGDPADCRRVVSEVLDERGHVDILVNNAGISVMRPVRRMTVDDWHAVLRVNLSGAFYMCTSVLESMVGRRYGRIVNISSVLGQTGSAGHANYAASKSGLFGFTKSLALETAHYGVTVNCVTPGFVQTDLLADVDPDVMAEVVRSIPMGRMGTAEEVANTVRFLVDDDAAYMTGAILAVNGGLDM